VRDLLPPGWGWPETLGMLILLVFLALAGSVNTGP
jgi:hypothetical protein